MRTTSHKRVYSGAHRKHSRGRRGNRTRSSAPRRTQWQRHGTALPGWGDLAEKEPHASGTESFLERVSTVRFALTILALAAAFTLYVGHVHATQDLLTRLQQARQTNRVLHLKHNRLTGAYDRATGPAVIHERARQLGLVENLSYGPPIRVDE